MSVALYRRYRPETFAEVIGQSQVTVPLTAALRRGKVNHAYLFSGPRGCGKTTSARILARTLNCALNTPENPIDTPCGECPSCIDLSRLGTGSLDVVEIDAASHGGVDAARELRERATFIPTRDNYKIFIIDEAHMVTKEGFNALLKVVEEPPPHIKFIFATTEPEKVLGTIRSRTQHYPFRLVPPAVLGPYLEDVCAREGVSLGEGVLALVLRAGGGSVRDTLSVLDQLIAGSPSGVVEYATAIGLLGYTPTEIVSDAIAAIAARSGASLFSIVARVIDAGTAPARFVEDLLERIRDLIVVSISGDQVAVALADKPAAEVAELIAEAEQFELPELARLGELLSAGLNGMVGAIAPQLQLELLVARLVVPGGESQADLLARITELERQIASGVGAAPVGRGGTAPPGRRAATVAQTAVPSAPPQQFAPQIAGDPGDEEARSGVSKPLQVQDAKLVSAQPEALPVERPYRRPLPPPEAASPTRHPSSAPPEHFAPQTAGGSRDEEAATAAVSKPRISDERPALQGSGLDESGAPEEGNSPIPSSRAEHSARVDRAESAVAGSLKALDEPNLEIVSRETIDEASLRSAGNSSAAGSGDLAILQDAWSGLAAAMTSPVTRSMLTHATGPTALAGDVVTVGVGQPAIAGRLNDPRHITPVSAALSEILGRPVQVQFAAGATPPAPQTGQRQRGTSTAITQSLPSARTSAGDDSTSSRHSPAPDSAALPPTAESQNPGTPATNTPRSAYPEAPSNPPAAPASPPRHSAAPGGGSQNPGTPAITVSDDDWLSGAKIDLPGEAVQVRVSHSEPSQAPPPLVTSSAGASNSDWQTAPAQPVKHASAPQPVEPSAPVKADPRQPAPQPQTSAREQSRAKAAAQPPIAPPEEDEISADDEDDFGGGLRGVEAALKILDGTIIEEINEP